MVWFVAVLIFTLVLGFGFRGFCSLVLCFILAALMFLCFTFDVLLFLYWFASLWVWYCLVLTFGWVALWVLSRVSLGWFGLGVIVVLF